MSRHKKIFSIFIGLVSVLGIILIVWQILKQTDNSVIYTAPADMVVSTPVEEQTVNLFEQLGLLDSDGDGLADFEELQLGRNPKKQDFSYTYKDIDTDQDGVPDNVEDWLGTDSQIYDTDGDGLGDLYAFEKIQFGQGTDSDKDGLPDHAEIKWYGTDPNNPDTDGDKYKDGDEVLNGYNPKGSGQL